MLEISKVSSVLSDAGVECISCQPESKLECVVRVSPEHARKTLATLRDSELECSILMDTFGADMGEKGIEVTYYLMSQKLNADVHVKCRIPQGGSYWSVTDEFLSALFPERELCEMFGLFLEGHSNPKRLLTSAGYINPLLKSTEIRGKEEVWNRL